MQIDAVGVIEKSIIVDKIPVRRFNKYSLRVVPCGISSDFIIGGTQQEQTGPAFIYGIVLNQIIIGGIKVYSIRRIRNFICDDFILLRRMKRDPLGGIRDIGVGYGVIIGRE